MEKENVIYSLGERICTEEPNDPSLSSNGGDYYFYETPVYRDGVEIGLIFSTSSDFSYCQVSGNFTDTVGVEVPELGIYITVNKQKYENCEEVTVNELWPPKSIHGITLMDFHHSKDESICAFMVDENDHWVATQYKCNKIDCNCVGTWWHGNKEEGVYLVEENDFF